MIRRLGGAVAMAFAAALALAAVAPARADPPRVADSEDCAGDSVCPVLMKLESASDWQGLEALASKTLAALPATPAGAVLTTQEQLFLAEAFWREKRYPEAEALLKSSLEARLKIFGQGDSVTINVDEWLVDLDYDQGKFDDAITYSNAALAGYAKALKTADVKLAPKIRRGQAAAMANAAQARLKRQNYDKALDDLSTAVGLDMAIGGALDPDALENVTQIAYLLMDEQRYDEGTSFLNDFIAKRDALASHADLGTNQLVALRGEMLLMQDRDAEAEPDLTRAIAAICRPPISSKTCPPILLQDQGLWLSRRNRLDEATQRIEQAMSLHLELAGPVSIEAAGDHENLAELLYDKGDFAGAEREYAKAQDIATQIWGPDAPGLWRLLDNHARALEALNRLDEAGALLERSKHVLESLHDPDSEAAAEVHEALGSNEGARGLYEQSANDWRVACTVRTNRYSALEFRGLFADSIRQDASDCYYSLDLALWDWSARGGGAAASDKPDALAREAFAATQNVDLSAAGDALAASASITVAAAAGVGPLASDYEATLRARNADDDALTQPNLADDKRKRLTTDRDAATAKLSDLARQLRQKSPQFWDYRSPQPVTVDALQAKAGADAALLHDDEALVLFLEGGIDSKGFVFAVSKDKAAWAQLSLTGDALKAQVAHLRCQVDLQGAGMRSPTQTGGACAGARQGAFDRTAAYNLHQALLGAPAIQAVIAPKHTLIFVPSGPLISLPPGLLVAGPPQGGAEGDSDPKALRATPWLLRSKAVALLPTVNALRTLRQLTPAARAAASDPLLAFADPAFGVATASNATALAKTPLAKTLVALPPLPWTRIEGQSLRSALDAPPSSLLFGPAASKAALMARNRDGRLAKVQVLEFATHGLMAPLGDGHDEPALAMAAGPRPQDGVLLASEAATLKLDADWVLLSACNTADPDAPEAQGLSGLSRAFFFAGARSLLVSHWRVRDDVAARLVPAILQAEHTSTGIGRAEALRRASMSILDDPDLNAAHPAAWAPFTLIGEAGG